MSQRLVQPSAYMALSPKIDGPGVCGMDYPFKVSAFNNGAIGLKSKVTLACPIIPRIDTWLDEIVKPAALMYFGVPVVDVKAGSYSCRPRNNRMGAKLSEHSFGNALDVMGFVLADGRQVSVVKGWKGDPAEQEFLREAFVGACRYFTTVLGPGSDAFHYDHLHIDLARHDPQGKRRVCKPILKFTPRIDPEQSRLAVQDMPPTADLAPIDMEQDSPEEEAPLTSRGADIPQPQPYAGPISRPPANAGYAADLPAPNASPPNGAYPRSPQAQTYAPPASQRPWSGGPLPLAGSGIY